MKMRALYVAIALVGGVALMVCGVVKGLYPFLSYELFGTAYSPDATLLPMGQLLLGTFVFAGPFMDRGPKRRKPAGRALTRALREETPFFRLVGLSIVLLLVASFFGITAMATEGDSSSEFTVVCFGVFALSGLLLLVGALNIYYTKQAQQFADRQKTKKQGLQSVGR